MKKEYLFYIITIATVILLLEVSFSFILYNNVKKDIKQDCFVNSQNSLKNMISLLNSNLFSILKEENLFKDFKFEKENRYNPNFYIFENNLFIKNGEKFYKVPEESKNIFLNIFYEKRDDGRYFSIFIDQNQIPDEVKKEFERYYILNSSYGFFETKNFLVSYKKSKYKNLPEYTMIFWEDKNLEFKYFNDILFLFVSIHILVLVFIATFISFYINAFYTVIKVEEEAKKNLELLRINRTLTIEKFSEAIVHNINNPLTTVYGYLQILVKKRPELVRQFKLDKVIENIEFVSNQLKLLLNKKTTNIEEYIDLNEFVKNELKFLSQTFRSENISVSFYEGGGLPRLKINKNDLKMVFDNIIDNAIDALQNSSIKNIMVRTYFKNHKIFLEIEDTGEGISDEIKEKIFDLYFTTKDYQTYFKKGSGTGIGLYSVKKIVNLYNGEITFSTILSKGTTFIISFPAD
ncbi:MAG: HAMP domain-containing sensor histidine kinase [bacterium]|nr:HAMP domain-containing sensor histidine kinase [bacterium]